MIDITIKAKNLRTEFGFWSGPDRTTTDSFMRDNDVKEIYSHDWQDENGIEYDTLAPIRLKPRTFIIEGYMQSSGESDFWTKYNGLRALLRSAVTLPIEVKIEQQVISVNARFVAQTDFKRNSSLSENGFPVFISMQFEEIL